MIYYKDKNRIVNTISINIKIKNTTFLGNVFLVFSLL